MTPQRGWPGSSDVRLPYGRSGLSWVRRWSRRVVVSRRSRGTTTVVQRREMFRLVLACGHLELRPCGRCSCPPGAVRCRTCSGPPPVRRDVWGRPL